MPEPCPTCGSLVTIQGSDEGTQHYEPVLLPVLVYDTPAAMEALVKVMIEEGCPIPTAEDIRRILQRLRVLRGA